MKINKFFLNLTFLKVISQLTLMSPVFYYFFTNNVALVGKYMVYVPFVSILIELIAPEWVKFAIFKRVLIRDHVITYLIGFVIVISLLILVAMCLKIERLYVVLLFSSLGANILSQHLVDLVTLLERIDGNKEIFQNYLAKKLLIVDIIFPLIITALLWGKNSDVAFYLGGGVGAVIVTGVIVAYVRLLPNAKPNSANLTESALSIYPYLFAKRIDSQAFRLALSITIPAPILGALFPIVIISRGVNVVGNFVHYFYIDRIERVFTILSKNYALISSLVLLPVVLAYLIKLMLTHLGYSSINVAVAAAFLSINFSAIIRLFSRGIKVKYGRNNDVTISLFIMALFKFCIAYLLSGVNYNLMFLFLIYVLCEAYLDCRQAKNKLEKRSKEV